MRLALVLISMVLFIGCVQEPPTEIQIKTPVALWLYDGYGNEFGVSLRTERTYLTLPTDTVQYTPNPQRYPMKPQQVVDGATYEYDPFLNTLTRIDNVRLQ